MTPFGQLTNVIPAEAGIHDTSQRRRVIGGVAPVESCVDGRLRGHDGRGEFAADTEKLIGISVEGPVRKPCPKKLVCIGPQQQRVDQWRI